ncbi:CRZ2 [Candida theae]|uniref:pH-response transcription factor pacC/RIM101 n=1 Tax=Candida theae TaxID=1198502 RepID=A0AAD5BAD2_9ASCO|nr:CRZ2 [Candida theae]KAI5948649.1 CRZ2 [Candida theae]
MTSHYSQDTGARNGCTDNTPIPSTTESAPYLAGTNYNFIPEYKPYLQSQPYNQPQSNSYWQAPQHTKQQQQLPSINVLQAQTIQQVQQEMAYSHATIPAQNMGYPYFTQQDYTTGQPYITIPNYTPSANYYGKYTNAPQQRFPLSPVSLPDKSTSCPTTGSSTSSASSSHYSNSLPQVNHSIHANHANHAYTSHHYQQLQQQQQQQSSSVLPAPVSEDKIDYSSLVSYTISPSLKRKRRKRNESHALSSSSSSSSSAMPTIPAEEEESYPCPACDKVFQKPYNLKSHMRSHSNEKPYACAHCSKRFCRSHDRKRHEQLHKGARNFRCEGYLKDGVTKWGCGKKFARSDALARHFRTETGWLCIRPLMDEARKLDEGGATSGGGASGALLQVVDGTAGANSTSDNKSSAEEDLENSNMIRRMIHNR